MTFPILSFLSLGFVSKRDLWEGEAPAEPLECLKFAAQQELRPPDVRNSRVLKQSLGFGILRLIGHARIECTDPLVESAHEKANCLIRDLIHHMLPRAGD